MLIVRISLLFVMLTASLIAQERVPDFDPAKARVVGEQRIQIFPRETTSEETMDHGVITFRETPVVGGKIPFEIAFVSKNGRIMTGYHLSRDLVITLSERIDLSVETAGRAYAGTGTVVVPSRGADFAHGIFRGTLQVNRVSRELGMTIALTSVTGKTVPVIARTTLAVTYGQTAGILFITKPGTRRAGEEIEVQVFPYNSRGERILELIERKLTLNVTGDQPLLINGATVRGLVTMDAKSFTGGSTTLKIRTEKAGTIALTFSAPAPPVGRTPGAWNSLALTIVPDAPAQVKISMVPRAAAGDEIALNVERQDQFGNRVEGKGIDATITPCPLNAVNINGTTVADSGTLQLSGVNDRLVITRAGEYRLTALMFSAAIIIFPGIADRPDIEGGDTLVTGMAATLQIIARDRYGNRTALTTPVTVEAPAALLPAKRLIIAPGDRPEAMLSLSPTRAGTYDIAISSPEKRTGFTLTVKPAVRPAGTIDQRSGGRDHPTATPRPALNAGGQGVTIDLPVGIVDEQALMRYLVAAIDRNPATRQVILRWREQTGKIRFQNELTYYRDWDRIDHQRWNQSEQKRARRILWRKVQGAALREALRTGEHSIPGAREVYQ